MFLFFLFWGGGGGELGWVGVVVVVYDQYNVRHIVELFTPGFSLLLPVICHEKLLQTTHIHMRTCTQQPGNILHVCNSLR